MAGPRKKNKEEERKKKGNIQSMLRNMPSKKADTAIKDDDILGELLSEISTTKEATRGESAKPENKNRFCHTIHSNIT